MRRSAAPTPQLGVALAVEAADGAETLPQRTDRFAAVDAGFDAAPATHRIPELRHGVLSELFFGGLRWIDLVTHWTAPRIEYADA